MHRTRNAGRYAQLKFFVRVQQCPVYVYRHLRGPRPQGRCPTRSPHAPRSPARPPPPPPVGDGRTVQNTFLTRYGNLENFDESLENVDINSVVVKHAKFIKNNLKFESSNELGVIANGWVRTRK